MSSPGVEASRRIFAPLGRYGVEQAIDHPTRRFDRPAQYPRHGRSVQDVPRCNLCGLEF